MSTTQLASRIRTHVTAGVLAPGLLLLAASPALAHRLEKHFNVEPRAVITIHNPNGKIIVRAWTKHEIMVVANHDGSKVEVTAEQTGNRVDLRTEQFAASVSPDDLRADYEISVPEDAELQIHDDSGEVTVMNVLGDMNVETVAAGVVVSDAAGYLTVKTVGGDFQCLRCAGRLEVSSISGTFKLLELRSYYVRAQSSTGNILFDGEFLPNGIYRLKNYSGKIEVRFSPGDSFDLNAKSLKGQVNNDAKLTPPAHPQKYNNSKFGYAIGAFNAGRAKVELASFDGTINVRKRD
jgi:DUF4097 and DUF4098 domain-containing protein YvlB